LLDRDPGDVSAIAGKPTTDKESGISIVRTVMSRMRDVKVFDARVRYGRRIKRWFDTEN
jgi:hypothetical protein